MKYKTYYNEKTGDYFRVAQDAKIKGVRKTNYRKVAS